MAAITYFVTDAGVRVPAITAEQMREVDRIAIEERGPNLYQMMENAGRNLAALALRWLGGLSASPSILVMAGTGGNGGGGICAARHLANHRAAVSLCLTDPKKLGPVPAQQRRVFASSGGREISLDEARSGRFDVILDAIIGYSLSGAPSGATLQFIEAINAMSAPVISLDNPSGLDVTTGKTPGAVVRADATMTLALPKTGLAIGKTGELYLADIGIPQGVYNRMNLPYESPFGGEWIVRLTAA